MGTRYNRLAEAVLTGTHNICLEQKYKSFYLKIFSFLVVKFSIYLYRRVFVMVYSDKWVCRKKKVATFINSLEEIVSIFMSDDNI